MSWADDEEYRRSLRQPEDEELAEVAEYRRAKGVRFVADVTEDLPAPNNSAARDALEPILRMRKGLARTRVLDVVCRRDHRLAEVLRTANGLVVRGDGPATQLQVERVGGDSIPDPDGGGWMSSSWSYDWQKTVRASRARQICLFLDDLLGRTQYEGQREYVVARIVVVQCRCRAARISGEWLNEQIEAGRRRVVFE
ncbi:hypothetical protein AB0873_09580 [Micromonospora sp. NPDC047707]|uniref:hypothetical protein n=1 Tax=Micromonospora sp. NPDC047707 TaxID=3154498 RepID=UPI003452C613